MAIYTNLPIYREVYSLLVMVSTAMPNLPKDCKYSIGVDLRNRIVEMIIMIYKANRLRYKLPIIEKMQESLVEVSVYMRLMCDLKYISQRQYVVWIDQSSSISKNLSAWERSERIKKSDV